jgi:hypothetical protein
MSKFLKWVVNIVLIVSIVVTVGLLVPPLVGVTTVIVDDVDMVTNLNRGSVTYGISKELNELSVGDNIIMKNSEGDYIYRLNAIDIESGSCELEDIKSADRQQRTEVFKAAIPKAIITVPFIGYIVMAMKSTEGLIIIGLAVIFVIILFVLSELWKKDDEEDEEDEEEEEVATSQTLTRNADMSAHILEKVSSEIGSEISEVVAKDLSQSPTVEEPMKETAAAEDLAFTKEVDTTVKEQQGEESVVIDVATEAEMIEIANEVADMPMELAGATEAEVEETEIESPSEADVVEVEQASLEPKELAIPAYTATELIEKAKAAKEDPEVKKDEVLGITILDYSDIL